ncbi:hypothetical protein Salat_1705000 [Sesamum alatum]|uniref:Uncharacterized protein n=1 Tax=Sesamum alatum TaxID=300844 RepID=A0AAE1Y836_9LAMI|nr:hypothetical protein Salat_1705000 [Sesamum alatum]
MAPSYKYNLLCHYLPTSCDLASDLLRFWRDFPLSRSPPLAPDRLIMQARIANRLRAKKGTLPPNIAPLTDSSQPGASSAPGGRSSGNLGNSSTPLELAPTISPIPALAPIPAIEIASGDTEVAGKALASLRSARESTRALAAADPANGASRVLKKRKAKQAVDKAEEVEKPQTCSRINRVVEGGSHRIADSQVCIRRDGGPWLFGHHLSLRCSYLRREKFASDEKLEESNSSRAAVEERVKQLKAQLEDLTFRSHIEVDTARSVALEAGKKEGFSVGCEAGKVEGLLAGRDAYLASEAHKEFVK